ncbi:hypothetical protein [Streptosporangium sandarakinum]|uniref:hypothetical protein n=1 Tax=Streptosporangium sandarakinum TaxID=1260955 RepID=UPI003436991E
MRRVTTTLGALAAAAALALTVSQPAQAAQAAQGALIINGAVYYDPSGCYGSDVFPLDVENQTDGYAYIWNGPYCTGDVVLVLSPDTAAVVEEGVSVFVE